MPRINIEDSLYRDPRFMRLCITLKDECTAIGMLVQLWVIAQKHWAKDRALIPREEFPPNFSLLIDLGFAEERETGVYAKGSEEHFSWLLQRVEAGRKGGLAKASGAKRSLAVAKRNVAAAKRALASSSSSSSFSKYKTSSSDSQAHPQRIEDHPPSGSQAHPPEDSTPMAADLSESVGKLILPTDQPQLKARAFIGAYAKAYKAKYNASPHCLQEGKTIGQVMRWVANLSEEKAVKMAEAYVSMQNPWFEKKAHDLHTFFQNLNEIGNYAETGKQAGDIDWEYVFGRKEK